MVAAALLILGAVQPAAATDISDEDFQEIRRGLSDGERSLREAAMRKLIFARHRNRLSLLTSLLSSPYADIRTASVRVLVRLNVTDSFATIGSLLESDPVESVRVAAAYALGLTRNVSVVPQLLKALSQKSIKVRRAVVAALTSIPDPRAEKSVIAALKDSPASIRPHLLRALGRMGSRTTAVHIVPHLNDPSAQTRAAAVLALSKLRAKQVLPSILALLADKHDAVRDAVLTACQRFRDKRATLDVVKLLHDANPRFRLQAIQTLIILHDRRAVPYVIRAMSREDGKQNRSLEAALQALTGQRLGPLPGPWTTWWQKNQ